MVIHHGDTPWYHVVLLHRLMPCPCEVHPGKDCWKCYGIIIMLAMQLDFPGLKNAFRNNPTSEDK